MLFCWVGSGLTLPPGQGRSLRGAGGAVAPQNFPNFVKFLGKMATRRKFCIVGENLAPQTKSPGYGPAGVCYLLELYEGNFLNAAKEVVCIVKHNF